jgi:hypothetical protein
MLCSVARVSARRGRFTRPTATQCRRQAKKPSACHATQVTRQGRAHAAKRGTHRRSTARDWRHSSGSFCLKRWWRYEREYAIVFTSGSMSPKSSTYCVLQSSTVQPMELCVCVCARVRGHGRAAWAWGGRSLLMRRRPAVVNSVPCRATRVGLHESIVSTPYVTTCERLDL